MRLKLVISKNSPPKFPDHAVTMAQTRADPSLRLREQDKKSKSEGVPWQRLGVKPQGLIRGKVTAGSRSLTWWQGSQGMRRVWEAAISSGSEEEGIRLEKWLKNEGGGLGDPKCLRVVSSVFRKWETLCSFLLNRSISRRTCQIYPVHFHPANTLGQDVDWLFWLKSYTILFPYRCKIITSWNFSDGIPENVSLEITHLTWIHITAVRGETLQNLWIKFFPARRTSFFEKPEDRILTPVGGEFPYQ